MLDEKKDYYDEYSDEWKQHEEKQKNENEITMLLSVALASVGEQWLASGIH